MTGRYMWCAAAALCLAMGGQAAATNRTLDLAVHPTDVRVQRAAPIRATKVSEAGPAPEVLNDPGAMGTPSIPIRRLNEDDNGFLGGLLGGKTIPLFRVTVPGAVFGNRSIQ
ncbi:MAG: hypothetical protein U1E45_17000 [Geminicoccaceae bacterium]